MYGKKILQCSLCLTMLLVFSMTAQAATIFQNNVLTAQHKLARGAQVAIIPPAGSQQSSSFVGFSLKDGASIRISEQRGAFSQNIGSYTADFWLKKGYHYKQSSDAVLNGSPARLFEMSLTGAEGGDQGVWLFVIGDSRRTIFLEGRFLQANPQQGQQIRRSLLSAFLQVDRPEAAASDFTLSVAGTPFKFAEMVAGVRYFTLNGKPVGNEVTDALFTASKIAARVSDQDRQTFAKDTVRQRLGGNGYEITSIVPINKGSLSGYEIVADIRGASVRNRTSGGAPSRILRGGFYQQILFSSDSAYLMQGVAARQPEVFLGNFRTIAASFKAQ